MLARTAGCLKELALAMALLSAVAATATAQHAAGGPCEVCPPRQLPTPWATPRGTDAVLSPTPEMATDIATDQDQEGSIAAPSPVTPLTPDESDNLDLSRQTSDRPPASAVASSSTPQSNFAPNMIGDFFGPRSTIADVAIPLSPTIPGVPITGAVLQPLGTSGFADELHLTRIESPAAGGRTVFYGGPLDADEAFGSTTLSADVASGAAVIGGLSNAGARPSLVDGGLGTGEYVAVRRTGDALLPTVTVLDSDAAGLVTPDNPPTTLVAVPADFVYDVYEIAVVDVSPNPGDRVGRVRMQDNNSALPQDRFYFDYNYFHNAAIVSGGADVSRYTLGFEKTFFCGTASLDVRMPMASTVSSDLVADSGIDFSRYEFGNLTLAPKVVLASTRDSIWAAGLGISLPTADATSVSLTDGRQLLKIRNDAVHLIPYLAASYQPAGGPWFAHGFLTLDVDAGGNRVEADLTGEGLESIGRYNDQTLLSVDLAVGSWVYENCSCNATVDRVGWSAELHYTAAVNDADAIERDAFFVGDPEDDLSVLNGTFGAHARVRQATFTAAYTVPFNGDERVFDGEFRFFVNRNF